MVTVNLNVVVFLSLMLDFVDDGVCLLVKKRFFVHKKPNVIKKMKKLIVERRKTLKKVFLRRFCSKYFFVRKKEI